jgi:hypothetical protein
VGGFWGGGRTGTKKTNKWKNTSKNGNISEHFAIIYQRVPGVQFQKI